MAVVLECYHVLHSSSTNLLKTLKMPNYNLVFDNYGTTYYQISTARFQNFMTCSALLEHVDMFIKSVPYVHPYIV